MAISYHLLFGITHCYDYRPQFLPMKVWRLEHQHFHMVKMYFQSEKLEHNAQNTTGSVVIVFSITCNVYQWQRFDNCQQAN